MPMVDSLVLRFFFFFFLIHRFHSISFTRAQGIPKYKIGFGREKDGRVGERLVVGGGFALPRTHPHTASDVPLFATHTVCSVLCSQVLAPSRPSLPWDSPIPPPHTLVPLASPLPPIPLPPPFPLPFLSRPLGVPLFSRSVLFCSLVAQHLATPPPFPLAVPLPPPHTTSTLLSIACSP